MKKITLIAIVLIVLLVITGGVVFSVLRRPAKTAVPVPVAGDEPPVALPTIDPSVQVTVTATKGKPNTITVAASGLANTIASVAYEVTYDSEGLIKGVNSGSKPIEVAGKDTFEREVYLGTCSRNVCKPDTGVKAVSVVLEFTDADGNKSQFSREFPL